MKIEQKPQFQPITITLESAIEAGALWYAAREQASVMDESKMKEQLNQISNWFSNNAQLGGAVRPEEFGALKD